MTNWLILFLLLTSIDERVFAYPNCNIKNIAPLSLHTFSENEQIKFLPGLGCVDRLELSGYLSTQTHRLSNDPNEPSHLFYWFVASEHHPESAPLVLWLNGGPGSASLYGFLVEHGPYQIKQDKVIKRPYHWATEANYLVIDQPASVGFSYADSAHLVKNEEMAINELYHALQIFFKRYPALITHDFYLAGESYAGKYLPELAVKILHHSSSMPIKLRGLLLGDPWIDPKIQQEANADYAYSHGLVDENTQQRIKKLYRACAKAIDEVKPSSKHANQICQQMQNLIALKSGLSLANIQINATPGEEAYVNYLNQPAVRTALHIDKRVKKFSTFNEAIEHQLEIGVQDSVVHLLPDILNHGVKVLIYNGLDDAKDANFMGTDKWLSKLVWNGQSNFLNAPTCIWRLNHQIAGYVRTANHLTQVKIRNAGHMAPYDKPYELYRLLQIFLFNRESFC